MKKIISLIFASLVVVFGLSVDSFGQTSKSKPWSINNRQQRQQKRIYQGVKSSELTAKETYRLEKQQARIQRTETRYRASGDGLTWHERYKLQHKLNQSSHNIRQQKHDKQDYQYPKRKL